MAKLLPLPAQNVAFVNKEDGTPTTVFYTWLQSLMNCLGQWFPLSGVTIAPGSGSITAYTTDCRFLQLGKLVFLWLDVRITNNGTGASKIIVTFPSALPLPLQARNVIPAFDLSGDISVFGELADDRTMDTRGYNGGYPLIGASGELFFNGTYEAA